MTDFGESKVYGYIDMPILCLFD